MEPKKTYSIKLNPTFLGEWTDMLNEISEGNGFKEKEEALRLLFNLYKKNTEPEDPKMQGHISVIKNNISSILSNVNAMAEAYKTSKENQQQIFAEKQKGLADQVNELRATVNTLNEQAETDKKTIEALREELLQLKQENESLREQVNQQKRIDELLDSVGKLISDREEENSLTQGKTENESQVPEDQIAINDLLNAQITNNQDSDE